MSTTAKFITEIKTKDPDTKVLIRLSVYKHENGGMFAIDSSFIEQVCSDDDEITTTICDPFANFENPTTLYLKE